MRRKEERSKQDQTNNKAKQRSTPKAVTFLKKNELPQVGLEPTMYMYVYFSGACMDITTSDHSPLFASFQVGGVRQYVPEAGM